jgi:carboxyl-terminal processing protease
MKTTKKWKLLLLTILVSFGAKAQVADSVYYQRLYYACKAWGHVKYYHTEVANGNVNWDSVLLVSANSFKTAPDNAAFNDSLLVMINKAGVMGTSAVPMPEMVDSICNNTDMSWINSPTFSIEVRAALDTIRMRFRPQSHVLVGQSFSDATAFNSDNQFYSEEDYPNESKRILALFRYWNIINYFYPYKKIMDQDWDTTLVEFIPQIVNAQEALSYHLSFREFTNRINDSHSSMFSPIYNSWNGRIYPPFLARYIENKMVITYVMPTVTDIHIGDVITKMDGIDIDHYRDSLRKYAHGSNDVEIESNLNQLVLKGPKGDFSITVSNGINENTYTLIRDTTYFDYISANSNVNPVWKDTLLNNDCRFGIVDMSKLQTTDVQTMFDELWNTDAIIFDIRNYPNGTLWSLVDYLFSSPIHIANFTYPDNTYPGRLDWIEETIGTGMNSPYEGKIILLFDERTQSQAEYTCMGLEQFPGALKIGSTTSAADGNVALIYLPGKIGVYATFLGTYYPDYTPTQRVGIIPDIEVLPTILGVRAGRDEVMETALNCNLVNVKTEKMGDFKIYPNPATNVISYEFPANEPATIEIYDLMGVRCSITKNVASNGSIDVSGLKGGVYMVKIIYKNKITTSKIIKI